MQQRLSFPGWHSAHQPFLVSGLVLLGWWCVYQAEDRWGFFRTLAWSLFCLAIAIALLMPAFEQVRESARRTCCWNNIRQLMLAMHNYQSANGCFPTDRIVITDDGQELRHSWRIVILPFVEGGPIYAAYDFQRSLGMGPITQNYWTQCQVFLIAHRIARGLARLTNWWAVQERPSKSEKDDLLKISKTDHQTPWGFWKTRPSRCRG